jgi:hypothetical protein
MMANLEKLTQQQLGGYQQYRMQAGTLLDPTNQCLSSVDALTELSTSSAPQECLQNGLQLHATHIRWNYHKYNCVINM